MLAVAGILLALFVIAANGTERGDYNLAVAENNSAPAIEALARGDLSTAFSVQPAMGWVSLLLRAPFAAVAGSDVMWAYRLGVFVCLMLVVALGVVVGRRALDAGRSQTYVGVVIALLVLTPPGLSAVHYGHPEEFVAGTLSIFAVLCAQRGQRWQAAVLLGLAIGTKHWALIAAAPVLLPFANADRIKLLAVAAGVAAVFIVPGAVGDPTRYAAVQESLSTTQRVYPESAWFPVADEHPIRVDRGAGDVIELMTYRLPAGLERGIATMLTMLIAGAALVVLILRRRAGHSTISPLAFLGLLFVLRAVLDPMNLGYYATPMLLAFVTWEALEGPPGRLPALSVAATAAYMAIFMFLIQHLTGWWIFAAWAASVLVVALPLLLSRRLADQPRASASSSLAPTPASVSTIT